MQTHFHDAKINKKNYISAKSPRKIDGKKVIFLQSKKMSCKLKESCWLLECVILSVAKDLKVY